MKTRTRHFPGADSETSRLMMQDVDADEEAAIRTVADLRRSSSISLETLGFMLGTGANQVSRYLNRSAGVTLTNYFRIARCLGYRCRIVFEKAESGLEQPLSDLNLVSHRRLTARAPRRPG